MQEGVQLYFPANFKFLKNFFGFLAAGKTILKFDMPVQISVKFSDKTSKIKTTIYDPSKFNILALKVLPRATIMQSPQCLAFPALLPANEPWIKAF